jgi:hypothetical protein
MDGEGLKEVREWSRKRLVQAGVFKPSEEEAQAMAEAQANQQPDANTVFLMESAKKEAAAAELNQAKVAQTHADTISKLAAVEQGREAHAIALAGQLQALNQPQPAPPQAQQPAV